MAERAKENFSGGSLKYHFVYLKIRIFRCSYRYIVKHVILGVPYFQTNPYTGTWMCSSSNKIWLKRAARGFPHLSCNLSPVCVAASPVLVGTFSWSEFFFPFTLDKCFDVIPARRDRPVEGGSRAAAVIVRPGWTHVCDLWCAGLARL